MWVYAKRLSPRGDSTGARCGAGAHLVGHRARVAPCFVASAAAGASAAKLCGARQSLRTRAVEPQWLAKKRVAAAGGAHLGRKVTQPAVKAGVEQLRRNKRVADQVDEQRQAIHRRLRRRKKAAWRPRRQPLLAPRWPRPRHTLGLTSPPRWRRSGRLARQMRRLAAAQ